MNPPKKRQLSNLNFKFIRRAKFSSRDKFKVLEYDKADNIRSFTCLVHLMGEIPNRISQFSVTLLCVCVWVRCSFSESQFREKCHEQRLALAEASNRGPLDCSEFLDCVASDNIQVVTNSLSIIHCYVPSSFRGAVISEAGITFSH